MSSANTARCSPAQVEVWNSACELWCCSSAPRLDPAFWTSKQTVRRHGWRRLEEVDANCTDMPERPHAQRHSVRGDSARIHRRLHVEKMACREVYSCFRKRLFYFLCMIRGLLIKETGVCWKEKKKVKTNICDYYYCLQYYCRGRALLCGHPMTAETKHALDMSFCANTIKAFKIFSLENCLEAMFSSSWSHITLIQWWTVW